MSKIICNDVSSSVVLNLMAKGYEVGSAIAGAVGKVSRVDENGFILLQQTKSKKALVALVPLWEGDNIIAVENEDKTITLWNREMWSEPPAKITSEHLNQYYAWDGDKGSYLILKLPQPSELSRFTADAFIDIFDIFRSKSIYYPARLNVDAFMQDAAFELVRRLDTTPYQISNDFRLHQVEWFNALCQCRDDVVGSEKERWENQIEIFKRAIKHLLEQGFEEIDLSKLASESPEAP